MSLAQSGRDQLIAALDSVVWGAARSVEIVCDDPADASKLRLRFNKIRQTDRARIARDYDKAKTPEHKRTQGSQYDRLVFQIPDNGPRLIIHKEEESGVAIIDRMFAIGPDGERTPLGNPEAQEPESVEPEAYEKKFDTTERDFDL